MVSEKKGVGVTYFRNRIKSTLGQLFVRCGEKEESDVTQSFLPRAAKYMMILFAGEEKVGQRASLVDEECSWMH